MKEKWLLVIAALLFLTYITVLIGIFAWGWGGGARCG